MPGRSESESVFLANRILSATAPQYNDRMNSPESPSEPTPVPPEWWDEFEAARRRPLQTRFKYAFIRTYKPVLDDEGFRAFDSTEQYRQWCERNLPDWLGYGRI